MKFRYIPWLTRCWSIGRVCVIGGLLSAPVAGHALTASSVMYWSQKPFQYVAVDQDLRDVLYEMANAASVPIDVSSTVHGSVHGRWAEMPTGAFLDQIAEGYGLVWYFDGSLLSVSTSKESTTAILSLRGVSLARLSEGMKAAGLMDARFALRNGPTDGTAMVSGPPRFLSMVKQCLDAIANAPQPSVLQAAVASGSPGRRLLVFRGSQSSDVVFR